MNIKVATLLFVVFVLKTTYSIEDVLQKEDLPEENQREKRQYPYAPPWASHSIISALTGPPIQTFPIWQTQYQPIKRPYFIPVWGTAGRIQVYLPPQPLYINPGYPSDNPPKRFPGVSYLPPIVTEPPNTNDTTTIETDNKLNTDGPVWDQIPGGGSSSNPRPTRPTRKPGQSNGVTHPPLVHKATLAPDTVEKSGSSPIGGSFRPNSVQTTPRPQQPPKETPIASAQPSRCVWAIISCCSANSKNVSYRCFEQLGCIGAFWDNSPCESEFARSAISQAMNYYNTISK